MELQEKIRQVALGLHELFECPVCLNTMDSTLKQCLNGHGVCSSCASKIDKCPSCNQEIVLVFRQNTLLRQVLERLPKPCPYIDKGCNTVVFDKEHQTFCKFRAAECKIINCDWKGCVKDLINHVQKCHAKIICELSGFNVETGSWCLFTKNGTQEFFVPIVCQNRLFWKYVYRNSITKSIYHKFYYMKMSNERCDYYLSTSFKKGNLKFEHSCKASTEIDNHNCGGQNGLIISDLEMEHFRSTEIENHFSFIQKILKEDIP